MSTEEENPPVPNWLLKLEENREKRLKAKLGHEAGAGAKCQKCEDKCPGLDLHFWRKICKACKCGKEDHDIVDDDIYGYVQFQLLGSKPVKSKGVFLKGLKDEVILEWTPKGSSNDIKKYLDELPQEMIPVKGSKGAKIRKQRLQKQMPAHDIDSSLCHQLTEDEVKEMEEYVSHIRKNCVGQGKIIRLSLFKGNQHKITPPNPQFLSQIPPAQIASSQTVFLQSSDMSNNLHNLSLRDKSKNVPQNQGDNIPPLTNDQLGKQSQKSMVPNFIPQNHQQNIDNQNPAAVGINDINYYPSGPQNVQNIVHPLTTSNVERHQEQFEIQNANFDLILNPNLNYAPNYLNPVEQHQLPAQVGQPKDLKYPIGAQIPQKADASKPVQNANVNAVTGNPLGHYNPNYVNPVELNQIPTQVGQPKDINYPIGSFDSQNIPRYNNANVDKIINPLMQYNPGYINPVDQTQLPTQVGQPKDLKYPSNVGSNPTENLNFPPPINTATHPLMQRNPQNLGQMPQTQDLKYPQDQLNPIYPTMNNANIPLQQYNPNFVNPIENIQLATQIGQPKDLKYPSGEVGNPVNANLVGQKSQYPVGQYPLDQTGQLGHGQDFKYPYGEVGNSVNANLVGQKGQYPIGQYPNDQLAKTGAKQDAKYPSGEIGNPINANLIGQKGQYPVGQYPNDQLGKMGSSQDAKYPSGEIGNPVNANLVGQMGQYPIGQYPADQLPKIGSKQDAKYPSGELGNPVNANLVGQMGQYPIGQYPNDQLAKIGSNQDAKYPSGEISHPANANLVGQKGIYPSENLYKPSDIKNKPLIPILEAQNLINPFETNQNLQSVGYIRDIDYPTENLPQNQSGVDKHDQNLNQAPPKCHSCQENFEDGSVAISADRTTNLWHSKCFNCHTCKQPLADLLYFYHKETDNIYCGRDYAILKGIPRCLACDELIFVREYCLAEDNTFHIKHFCCYECDTPLAGNQYIMEGNQPVCIACENLKAEICNDCGDKIRPDEQGVSLQNLHWHATGECFACKKCRKALLGGKMLLRNENLFCSDICFKSF